MPDDRTVTLGHTLQLFEEARSWQGAGGGAVSGVSPIPFLYPLLATSRFYLYSILDVHDTHKVHSLVCEKLSGGSNVC